MRIDVPTYVDWCGKLVYRFCKDFKMSRAFIEVTVSMSKLKFVQRV